MMRKGRRHYPFYSYGNLSILFHLFHIQRMPLPWWMAFFRFSFSFAQQFQFLLLSPMNSACWVSFLAAIVFFVCAHILLYQSLSLVKLTLCDSFELKPPFSVIYGLMLLRMSFVCFVDIAVQKECYKNNFDLIWMCKEKISFWQKCEPICLCFHKSKLCFSSSPFSFWIIWCGEKIMVPYQIKSV